MAVEELSEFGFGEGDPCRKGNEPLSELRGIPKKDRARRLRRGVHSEGGRKEERNNDKEAESGGERYGRELAGGGGASEVAEVKRGGQWEEEKEAEGREGAAAKR